MKRLPNKPYAIGTRTAARFINEAKAMEQVAKRLDAAGLPTFAEDVRALARTQHDIGHRLTVALAKRAKEK